jgi:transketolase
MKELVGITKEIRALTAECISSIGAGHIGGSLSIVDVLTVLYYKVMNVDAKNPKMEGRDRLVVSKGHAGPAVYATLAHKGFFDKKELYTLNKIGTNLPSHCDMNKTPGVDMTTGSLGQGLSCAVGLALGS